MKITRKKATELFNTLSTFTGVYNKTFSMYLVLNNKKLMPTIQEVQEIQKTSTPSPEYMELQKKELEIVNKYVEKDEKDNPVLVGNNGFKINPEKFDVYTAEKNELIESNKEIIDEFETLKDNVEKLINEEIEIDLLLIPFECVPDEIGVTDLESLSTIIDGFGVEKSEEKSKK